MATQETAARRATRALGWLLLIPVIAAALFAGNIFEVRDRVFPAPTTLSTTTLNNAAGQAVSHQNELPAEPYWVTAKTLSGTGNASRSVTIAADSLQWRIDWRCDQGLLSVAVQPSGGRRQTAVQNGACPGPGAGYAVDSGRFTVTVSASSAWNLVIEQELDRPAADPPLPSMSAPGSAVLATGSFYGIDQQGQGTAHLYRLADGSYALRLEDFYVTPNTDFEIRLSVLAHPTSTPQYVSNPSVSIAPLPITAGSLNFPIPHGIDPLAYHSVVIWCDRLTSAYAAATMQPA
jgi:hypothetical protein